MSQEVRSRRNDERDSCRSIWFSYEWYNLGKKDSPTRVLLVEHGKGLYPNSEAMSSMLYIWEF